MKQSRAAGNKKMLKNKIWIPLSQRSYFRTYSQQASATDAPPDDGSNEIKIEAWKSKFF